MKQAWTVIFDADGLLLDSERVSVEHWRQVAAEMGLEGINAAHLRCIGTNPQMTRQILREAYGSDFPTEAFFRRLLEKQPRDGCAMMPLKPGAREILEALQREGVSLALASSSPAEYLQRELGGRGLLSFFTALVSGDMVSKSKPDPEIFLRAAALCGGETETAWVVEDSFNGIRAAHRAGMHPLMVPDLLQPDGEMQTLAEAILPDLFAVRDYLLERLAGRETK